MRWQIKFYEEAVRDMESLDGSTKKEVIKGTIKGLSKSASKH